MEREEVALAPGVRTLEAEGYNVQFSNARGLYAQGGTPKEIVDTLSAAMKKAVDTDEHRRKLLELGLTPRYMDPGQIETYWTEVETRIKPILEQGLAENR